MRASAPPVAVAASVSCNGEFLIVADNVYVDPLAIPMQIRSTTFRVMQAMPPAELGMRAPNGRSVLWTEHGTITPAGTDDVRGFYPLVSENGHYAALISTVSTLTPERHVLSVYRVDGGNTLVARFSIADLLTEDEINPSHRRLLIDDGGGSWFSGGSLDFSLDSRELVFRSPAHHVLRIRLADGVLLQEKP